jgi:predicted dehydrogenase
LKKLSWGLIGGGAGSQIGPLHRLGAGLDGLFTLTAGALDADPTKGKAFAVSLGIPAPRAYGDWRDMLAAEKTRKDRLDLVTIATPNATHFEIAKAFLAADFDVLCEKPMTMTVAEGEEIVGLAAQRGRICAVNYGYTGYPLVRHMRAMVGRGDLGRIRLVKAEFAHGFHADAGDADNPRVRWRYDPEQAGVSAVMADCGIHALNMACFVTRQEIASVSADFVSSIDGRNLEDDAMVSFRMTGGCAGRLWTSAIAVGSMHGLNIQVFGEKGGLRWAQEWPNQLFWTPLNAPTQILERGAPGLSPEADRASRVTIGHAEGISLAFGNIYRDLAEVIAAARDGRDPDPAAMHVPTSCDGLNSVAAVYAAVESAKNGSAWTEASPPMARDD